MTEGEKRIPRGHQLLPQEIKDKLPKLYENEELGLDALTQVKFFTPTSNWTWYGSEYDGVDLMFGLVIGHEIELGYWSMRELEEVRGPYGLPIERDLYFAPLSLRELMEKHKRERSG